MAVTRYTDLSRSGELARRAAYAARLLARCSLCPHGCGVDRTAGETGICRAGDRARVSSAGPHFGEERPLVGRGGSGTVFFAWCTLECVFCQNAEISQAGQGEDLTVEELAELFCAIQQAGCENLNLVSPTHYTPQILAALDIAAGRGVKLPLVWNTGGYEALPTLRLLEGVVDIYMPDIKYADPDVAGRLSGAYDYPERALEAVREMHRQVGDLVVREDAIARRGLLVRHLVLPEGMAGTAEVVRFLAEEVSPDTFLNIMDQYRPCHRAHCYPEVARTITAEEYREAVSIARAAGMRRLDGG